MDKTIYPTDSGIAYGWWKRQRDAQRAAEAERHTDLLEAIKDQPDPPCKTCPMEPACAAREIACRHFSQYVETGEWDETRKRGLPTAKWYARIHRDNDPFSVVRTQSSR